MPARSGADLTLAIGQDFAFQVYTADYRSDAVPFTTPAAMTCKDAVGQIAFETTTGADEDNMAQIICSEANGLIQVTIPRSVTYKMPVGSYVYDIWATLIDETSDGLFPTGQHVPVLSGRLFVTKRVTEMHDLEALA